MFLSDTNERNIFVVSTLQRFLRTSNPLDTPSAMFQDTQNAPNVARARLRRLECCATVVWPAFSLLTCKQRCVPAHVDKGHQWLYATSPQRRLSLARKRGSLEGVRRGGLRRFLLKWRSIFGNFHLCVQICIIIRYQIFKSVCQAMFFTSKYGHHLDYNSNIAVSDTTDQHVALSRPNLRRPLPPLVPHSVHSALVHRTSRLFCQCHHTRASSSSGEKSH